MSKAKTSKFSKAQKCSISKEVNRFLSTAYWNNRITAQSIAFIIGILPWALSAVKTYAENGKPVPDGAWEICKEIFLKFNIQIPGEQQIKIKYPDGHSQNYDMVEAAKGATQKFCVEPKKRRELKKSEVRENPPLPADLSAKSEPEPEPEPILEEEALKIKQQLDAPRTFTSSLVRRMDEMQMGWLKNQQDLMKITDQNRATVNAVIALAKKIDSLEETIKTQTYTHTQVMTPNPKT